MREYLPRLVRSYALSSNRRILRFPDLIHDQTQKSDAPKAVKRFCQELIKAGWFVRKATRLGDWAQIEHEQITASALLWEGRLLHLYAVPSEAGREASRGLLVSRR